MPHKLLDVSLRSDSYMYIYNVITIIISTLLKYLQNYRRDLFSTSKISKFDVTAGVTHNVFAFDVTVNHPKLVKVLHSFQDLMSVVSCQFLCKWPYLLEAFGYRFLHVIKRVATLIIFVIPFHPMNNYNYYGIRNLRNFLVICPILHSRNL